MDTAIPKLNAFKPTTKDGRELKQTLTAFYEDLKCEFTKMLNDMKEEFIATITAKDKKIEELSSEVTLLHGRIQKLEEKIDDQEAYERRDTLIFSGEKLPTSTPQENCATIVCKLLEENLNLKINASDISV